MSIRRRLQTETPVASSAQIPGNRASVRGSRGYRLRRRGGAIVELAIAFSIITSLTFGMVEFGYYFYVKNIFAGAARDGVRAGAPWNTTNSNITTAVTQAIAPTGLSTTNPLYSVAITDTSGNTISNIQTIPSGSQFEVTISATWGTIGAGFRPMALIGAGKIVTATCVMRKEY